MRKKLLVFWSWSDFKDVYQTAFLHHPDYGIELVSSSGEKREQISYPRLFQLRRRVAAGEFNLIIANSIMRSPYPRNKGWATTASHMIRYLTYQHRRLDTWWAPWVAAAGGRKTPLAIIDARDSHYVYPWDWPLLKASHLYFKRDLMALPLRAVQPLLDYLGEKRLKPHVDKLRPMSLGLQEERIASSARPVRERDIDIFMSGGDNLLRKMVREKCQALTQRYKIFINTGLLPFAEYQEMLQRSKLVICVESWGGETWRQYEVAAAGAVPLMSWPYTLVHEPLEPDRHAIYFSYIGDHFERQVEQALSDPERLQKMSDEARAFVLARKNRRRLVNHVVETTLAAFGNRA
ncbi:MAG TPA: glycosyltransferase [Candidatus Methylacidiphilales bacterium]|nr:glycosyltransferase [Candidatus Methylacidiphilales bacterium]